MNPRGTNFRGASEAQRTNLPDLIASCPIYYDTYHSTCTCNDTNLGRMAR